MKKKESSSKEKSSLELVISSLPSGRRLCMGYAREIALTGNDERWQKLIELYDANKKADLGDLCTEAGITHADFFAEVNREMFPFTEQAMKFARAAAATVVGKHLPRVVERGMLEAAKPEGITDRHYVMQNEGFHVAPKGMNINLNQQVGIQQHGLPSFEDEATQVGAVLQQPLQLEEGEEDYVDLDLIEEEEKVA